jgi:uncharacterized protein (TIGR02594 family)
MAAYCASAMHEDYFSWCGLTVGYCMVEAGIAPVFGGSDTSRFLWAAAWLGWGTPVTTPHQGDVLVFDFGGGDHHVTLFEKDNGDGTWSCHGGNQTHQVKLTNFPKSKLMGIRRPIAAGMVVPLETVTPVKPASQRFADCLALVLHDEGGNDDDPRDPGGRTSRGIEQREWDVWRHTHSGLPADVWQAPQDQIIAIYHESYWNPLNCDALPAGVDYVLFDYGVLSGIPRSAKILQGFVGTDVDGEIGPKTIAATTQADAPTLIKRISDERLAFMHGLDAWPTFGKGWTARVQRVRDAALAMVSAAAAPAVGQVELPKPQIPSPPLLPDAIKAALPDAIKAAIGEALKEKAMVDATITQQGGQATAPKIDLSALTQVLAALGQINTAAAGLRPPQPATASTTPILSPIDKALGGQALVGLKTPLAILAYAGLWILQAVGTVGPATGDNATTTAQVLSAVIAAFGGLGITSKIDRGVQALAAAAAAVQKLPAPPAATPTSGGS